MEDCFSTKSRVSLEEWITSEAATSLGEERAERLLEINMRLSTTHDLDTLLRFIVETAAGMLSSEAASVLLFDEEAGELRFVASTGSAPEELSRVPVPLGGSLAGTVLLEDRPLVVGDVSKDARHYEPAPNAAAFETRSLVGVPLRLNGKPIGVLEGVNKADGPFDRDDVQVLLIVAAQTVMAIRNAHQRRSLEATSARLKFLSKL